MQLKHEKTLAIIKPDALEQKNTGNIISLIEKNGLSITAMKLHHLSEEEARSFYSVHTGKPFFEPLITFMTSGPCIPMVLEGENALEGWRCLMGSTDPAEAPEGTLRKLYGSTVRHNAVHGSDSPETALNEIAFFFKDTDPDNSLRTQPKGN